MEFPIFDLIKYELLSEQNILDKSKDKENGFGRTRTASREVSSPFLWSIEVPAHKMAYRSGPFGQAILLAIYNFFIIL